MPASRTAPFRYARGAARLALVACSALVCLAAAQDAGLDREALLSWPLPLSLAAAALLVATLAWIRGLRRQVHRSTAARHRADDLLRDVERMAQTGSYELDLAHATVTSTPGLFETLRLDPALGPPSEDALRAMLPPEDQDRFAELIAGARAGRAGEIVHPLLRGDGSRAVARSMARPILDAAGAVVAVRGTVMDVTTEHQYGEQLAAMRDEALRATAAKSEFLAIVSHELRTPLNGVIGMTTLLLESPLTREQRDQAETIRQCGTLLLEQVDEVLDFSRVEAGRLELEAAPFELRGLLDDTLLIVAERAHARGLELMLDADGSLPAAVVGDAGRLGQVVLNLLGNAIKFTESGHVLLVARAIASDRLELSVSDTGIGIAADAIPRLFQPFSQADRSTTRRFGGTGLGLAICRQLVTLMDGEIGVESEPGRGSRFWFTARLPEADPIEAPAPALPAGCRALCVDDHARHRAILAGMLERANVAAVTVGSIDEADAALGGGDPFGVILLDAEMAGAREWTPPAAPILALTADAGRLAAPRHWAAVLPRPVREPLLAATVGRLVGASPPPRRREAAEPTGAVAEPAPRDGIADLLVLVVDDNAINQRVASRSLQKLGCRVETAANGREAVEAALRTAYALILMDCQMPEMDGYEATRQIRARHGDRPPTPIIAMTAGARSEDRDACLACGMNDYLAKPFTLPDLQRMVARWAAVPLAR